MLRLAVRKNSREEMKDAGDYCIFNLTGDAEVSGIMFVCPHAGCGDRCHLPINRSGPNGWHWNEEKKTLSPSIQRLDEDHCKHHFSLIEGKWIP